MTNFQYLERVRKRTDAFVRSRSSHLTSTAGQDARRGSVAGAQDAVALAKGWP